MRIISGIKRGHKLFEFEGDNVRPTTDRVKESMFNLIQFHINDSIVLDLFAGSGALGLESLSRYAQKCYFIDYDKESLKIINKNIKNLNFTDRAVVIHKNAFDFINQTKDKFDIIFLDPPYNKGFINPIIDTIIENDILNNDGIIVLECDNTDLPKDFSNLEIIKQKKYGRTYITIYKKKG